MQLNANDFNQPLFICSNYSNYSPTFINFFGESKEIQSKLHSIVLGAKLFCY